MLVVHRINGVVYWDWTCGRDACAAEVDAVRGPLVRQTRPDNFTIKISHPKSTPSPQWIRLDIPFEEYGI